MSADTRSDMLPDQRPPTSCDRIADQLRRLAGRAHMLDKGSRLQVALIIEDALNRTLNLEEDQ